MTSAAKFSRDEEEEQGEERTLGIRKSINSPERGQRWDSGKTESRCGKLAPGTQGSRG